jgi:mRNA interferase RelE/StbE
LSWRVELSTKAQKELARLPDKDLQRAIDRIQKLAGDPWPHGVIKLEGGGFRLRVGDYRVLYDTDSKTRVITVYAIGHRREVYRR